MNASDIIKSKQCGALYTAYYNANRTILQGSNGAFSTIISTVTQIYASSNVTSTVSCLNTVYPYVCNKPLISYELGYDIDCGKYVCGGKVPSVTTWKANRAMGAITTFATSTIIPGSTILTSTLSSSNNLFAVRPLICPDPIFVQGTNFQSQCDVCNNFGAGVGACCHNCASGQ